MKKLTILYAAFIMAFAGCTTGQGWRPNVLTRLHNRIHGTANYGEPCDQGCAPAAPAPGCSTCGNGVASGYGAYESDYVGEPISIGSAPSTYATSPSAGEVIRPLPAPQR
ncbi:hypothetical protein SH467x_000349 [Pirellulaceae bacterium SH467]|jgi:hypothetical protein